MHEIIEQYSSLLETIDSWFDRTAQQYPQEIQCQTGCSGCCRGFFDVTMLDAVVVFHGYLQLESSQRETVRRKAADRLAELHRRWPGFSSPFILNGLPDSEWVEMPEGDETPCPFLDEQGICLIYKYRPMTCRLHGLPNIDVSGESFSDAYCSLNFKETDPLLLPQIRWEFRQAFEKEIDLFQHFTTELTGRPMNELDTLLQLVPLIDFEYTDWHNLEYYSLPKPPEPAE